jgi:hypothetical protein
MVMAVASLGEGRDDLAMSWMQRAAQMTLDLGMHHKSFADAEPNPILAESYRRTYWGLYVHGFMGTVRGDAEHFILYTVPSTTELPCEEWEYQSGVCQYQRQYASYYILTWATGDTHAHLDRGI